MSTLAIGDMLASGKDLLTAATTEVENNPVLNIAIFAAFVGVTMFIVLAPAGTTRPPPTTTQRPVLHRSAERFRHLR